LKLETGIKNKKQPYGQQQNQFKLHETIHGFCVKKKKETGFEI
jgi:hypothetical protein